MVGVYPCIVPSGFTIGYTAEKLPLALFTEELPAKERPAVVTTFNPFKRDELILDVEDPTVPFTLPINGPPNDILEILL